MSCFVSLARQYPDLGRSIKRIKASLLRDRGRCESRGVAERTNIQHAIEWAIEVRLSWILKSDLSESSYINRNVHVCNGKAV